MTSMSAKQRHMAALSRGLRLQDLDSQAPYGGKFESNGLAHTCMSYQKRWSPKILKWGIEALRLEGTQQSGYAVLICGRPYDMLALNGPSLVKRLTNISGFSNFLS